jgi:hypothetical protein
MAEETTLLRSEELLLKAQSGEKLEVDERRDAIAFIMATQPGTSNADMARLFGLSEGMIRKDKDVVRKRASEDISKEDVGLVIGDIRRTYERFISDIEKSLKRCEPGTKTYLDYQKALVDYQLKIVDALQSLGHYPKNLGTMATSKFVFKATVQKDGSIETKAIDATKPKTLEGKATPSRLLEESDEEKSLRDALREEWADTASDKKLLPKATDDDGSYDSEP